MSIATVLAYEGEGENEKWDGRKGETKETLFLARNSPPSMIHS